MLPSVAQASYSNIETIQSTITYRHFHHCMIWKYRGAKVAEHQPVMLGLPCKL